MAVKFLQIGDVHLGAKFESLGEKGAAHRKKIEDAFAKAVDLAVEKRVNLFLVTGDLFDTDSPSGSVVDFVKKQLAKLSENGIGAVLIPGNHDYLSERSVYRKSFWNDLKGVYVFNDPKKNMIEFPDFDLAVYAKVLVTKDSRESAIFKPEALPYKHNIMMAHGSVISSPSEKEWFFDQWPVTVDEIKNSKMDYIAFGNFHGLKDVSQGLPGQGDVTAWYSGSPETLVFDQPNSGHILFGEIDGKKVKIEPMKIGQIIFDTKEIILDNVADLSELRDKIVEGADSNIIRKITLAGFSRPDIFVDKESLEEELGEKFFKLMIIDKSAADISELSSDKFSNDMIVGQFVSLVKEKIEKSADDSEKDVLQKTLQLVLSEFER